MICPLGSRVGQRSKDYVEIDKEKAVRGLYIPLGGKLWIGTCTFLRTGCQDRE